MRLRNTDKTSSQKLGALRFKASGVANDTEWKLTDPRIGMINFELSTNIATAANDIETAALIIDGPRYRHDLDYGYLLQAATYGEMLNKGDETGLDITVDQAVAVEFLDMEHDMLFIKDKFAERYGEAELNRITSYISQKFV